MIYSWNLRLTTTKKIRFMSPAYAKRLDLKTRKTNVGAQKIKVGGFVGNTESWYPHWGPLRSRILGRLLASASSG